MKIAIGNDHAGTDAKFELIKYIESKGLEVINLGTDTKESTSYPIYGIKVAKYVASKKADLGIVICGTGVGISVAATRVEGSVCVVCRTIIEAKIAKEKHNMNVLSLGANIQGIVAMKMIVDEFLGL